MSRTIIRHRLAAVLPSPRLRHGIARKAPCARESPIWLLGGTALAVALTGCYYDVQQAYQTPMPWGERVEVACTGGKSMAIDFVPAPRAARVSFDGTSVTLPQVDSATDAKFTDGRYTLYVNEQRAALEETGILLRGPCTPR